MATDTEIQWTGSTFNPWHGCQKVSPGCDNCYAEGLNIRFYHGENWGPDALRQLTGSANWKSPRTWNRRAEREGKRHRVFCASMADVFDNHKSILPKWRADLWHLINETPWLDWQLLTKRPQNIAKMLPPNWGSGYPNVWLGTTVENQVEHRTN